MSRTGKLLQLYAFESDQNAWNNKQIYLLDIPTVWREFIRQFYNGVKLPFAIKPLGKKLQSIFPQIVSVNNQFYLDENRPWLIATQPVPVGMILFLAKGWMNQIATRQGVAATDDLDTSTMDWRSEAVDSILHRDSRLKYELLPALVAHQFCLSPKQLLLDNRDEPVELMFSQVYATQKAECMSEPITTRSGTFSYVVRFRLQYRAGEPERLLLMVSAGIRRFITKPQETKYLKGGINSTLLVSMDNPLIKDQGMGLRSYASLSFRREGGTEPYTRWSEGLDELFCDVLWGNPLSTEDILTNPVKYHSDRSPKIWVVHNNRVFNPLYVEAGISIQEKMRFYEMVRENVSDWRSLTPLPLVPKPKLEGTRRRVREPIPPVYCGHDKDFVLEVWGPDSLYQCVVEALKAKKYKGKLLAEHVDGEVFRLNSSSRNRIIVVKCDRKDYVDGLDRGALKDLADEHRTNKILRSIEHVKGNQAITCSLIEILPKDDWKKLGEGIDPKQAVRKGFQLTGRITQFVYPENGAKKSKRKKDKPESSYIHKVFNCILDLLGDAGVIDYKAHMDVNEQRPIIAYDLVSGDKGTYAILTKLEDGVLMVKSRGSEEWLSLSEAVLKTDQFDPLPKAPDALKKEVARWFGEQLRMERMSGKEPIVLVEAELRYKGLDGIQNNKIGRGKNPDLPGWIQNDQGMTVIRVNSNDDVPAYGFRPMSFSIGVYSDNESGLYYGVGTKPKTQRNIAKSMTKYDNPETAFQQPRVVEYMPLGPMDRQDRERLAWMVHRLREVCITFESTTAQPYPLKMTGTLKKYLQFKEYEITEAEAEFLEL
ncbi:DUF3962 domain-containing protein [Brevibacillus agri]|uniref:pPIWI_RE module domain-containing protein n=1 Tax=Brevibacillus agri TaxID=51101 RepID=UPI0018CCAAE5|nr:DUF3962 domain-containing protein [Brevibacillus agri]MBG9566168.1 hypothetical protein [Brevibacillus agri]MCG5254051.1 DUF3962 domain-containing protein [Brevibacillus agri]